MSKVLVGFFTKGGHTRKMAECISRTISAEGHDTDLKNISDIAVDSLPEYDAILLGTPVYYGAMAAEIKVLLDKSVKYQGKLEGKVGGAFSSSANVGGGNETAILNILHAFLIHGMIVQGMAHGDHYGPVSVESISERSIENCENFGKNITALLERLS